MDGKPNSNDSAMDKDEAPSGIGCWGALVFCVAFWALVICCAVSILAK